MYDPICILDIFTGIRDENSGNSRLAATDPQQVTKNYFRRTLNKFYLAAKLQAGEKIQTWNLFEKCQSGGFNIKIVL